MIQEGSKIAGEIMEELNREKYFKEYVKRRKEMEKNANKESQGWLEVWQDREDI